MTTPATKKKATARRQDWHPADVVAALRKAGWSLQQLAFHHGYTSRQAFSKALAGPYPRVERLIADALGTEPQAIWPTRYDDQGRPNRPSGPKPLRPVLPTHVNKDRPTKMGGNPQTGKAV